MLYVEHTLVKTLPKLQKEATDRELAQSFEEHLTETKQHVANVEEAFKLLGEKPKAEKCPGIEGINTEHDEFVDEEDPSPEVLDSHLPDGRRRADGALRDRSIRRVDHRRGRDERNGGCRTALREPRAGEGRSCHDENYRQATRRGERKDCGRRRVTATADARGPKLTTSSPGRTERAGGHQPCGAGASVGVGQV